MIPIMLSTLNGCTCHVIHLSENYKCVSCLERQRRFDLGFRCFKCQIGIFDQNGDAEYMKGLCTECYYG